MQQLKCIVKRPGPTAAGARRYKPQQYVPGKNVSTCLWRSVAMKLSTKNSQPSTDQWPVAVRAKFLWQKRSHHSPVFIGFLPKFDPRTKPNEARTNPVKTHYGAVKTHYDPD
jgi:hypothetical protein